MRPVIIQGGMGIGVSSWRLARAVARAGQLGVVSGVALDTILVRRLQLGDPDGSVRKALEQFPNEKVAARILDRYFVEGGIEPDRSFANFPLLRLDQRFDETALLVAANFVEIFLAKEGHAGLVGVNYLEKVQMATPAAVLGALLAGVDYVLMGAGIPSQIPDLLDRLAAGQVGEITVDIEGASSGAARAASVIDPAELIAGGPPRRRPRFLAIVSSHVLAQFLARDPATRPDGFVVETPLAGGHSAPPRGPNTLDELGQPRYGERDRFDASVLQRIGLPYWLAGGYGTREGLRDALEHGAAGVQVGSPFALCEESEIEHPIRRVIVEQALSRQLLVQNDPRASPTGFPFKVAGIKGTLSEPEIRGSRRRVCDLGYLRIPYERGDHTVGYRCPGEPVRAFLEKGGREEETVGRSCLCNGLLATIGLGQRRPRGEDEPPIVTIGQDLSFLEQLAPHGEAYSASDVVTFVLGQREPTSNVVAH